MATCCTVIVCVGEPATVCVGVGCVIVGCFVGAGVGVVVVGPVQPLSNTAITKNPIINFFTIIILPYLSYKYKDKYIF